MKKQLIFVAILSVFITGCKSKQAVVSLKNDVVTFKFIQVNDVYEIAPLSGGKYGGMARVAHVRDSVKAIEPNTFLVMAGDFLNPSLLGTLKVDGERIAGKHMIEVMNAMDFDLVTFGNHEFDLKEADFQKRLNEATFPWTTSNVYQVREDGNSSFNVIKENDSIRIPETYILPIRNKDTLSLNLGVFSVTVDSNPVDYVYYSDYLIEAQSAYNSLKQKGTDLIIGLTHLAISQDIELAKQIPQLPFIMGGHEHNSMLVPVNNTIIAKADANAKTVYIHTLTYNKKTKDLKIDSFLMPIDDKVSSSPKVKVVVDKWDAVLEKEIKQVIDNPNEVIYTANPPLDGTDSANRGIQTNLGDIITKAMALSFTHDVDAAIVNGGSFRLDDILEGEITSLDIFRVLPFGGEVFKIEIKGDLLTEVLNYGKSKTGTGAYLQRFNITESDVAGWLINAKPIRYSEVYTIAISDFLLKGYDIPILTAENKGVISVYKPNSTESASDIRKAVILYMKSLNK